MIVAQHVNFLTFVLIKTNTVTHSYDDPYEKNQPAVQGLISELGRATF